MSKARGLADLGNAYSDGALSNRNMIINGAMQVAQRGTSATSSGYQTVDRWYTQEGTGGAVTWSQSTDAPAGFVNSLGIEVTSGDSSIGTNEYIRIFQNVEGNVSSRLAWGGSGAKPAMLSFWVKSSITGTFGVAFQDSAVSVSYLQSYSVNSADTWEYKTVYVAPPTSGTWPTDNTWSIRLAFSFGMGSQYTQPASSTWYTGGDYRGPDGVTNFMGAVGNTLNITGVQLEVGDTATPFEHRSYSDQLQSCMRYYYEAPSRSLSLANATTSGYSFREPRSVQITFPVTMRATPTAVRVTTEETLSGGVILRASDGSVTCVPVSYAGDIPSGTYSYGHATLDAEL
jgi:hypothetical protein